MPYRTTSFAEGEIYHLYVRGNNKQKIVFDDADYARLIFSIIFLQAPGVSLINAGRYVKRFLNKGSFSVSSHTLTEIYENKSLSLICFSVMPNHFHVAVQLKEDSAATKYMGRVLNSYTKYINAKYGRNDHLFGVPYKAVHVGTNEQLLYLTAYIHRNPIEITGTLKKTEQYLYSSLTDYIFENRWEDLLEQDIILDQFFDKRAYQKFVKTSPAKEEFLELSENLL